MSLSHHHQVPKVRLFFDHFVLSSKFLWVSKIVVTFDVLFLSLAKFDLSSQIENLFPVV